MRHIVKQAHISSDRKILKNYRKTGIADLREMRLRGKTNSAVERARKFLRATHSVMNQTVWVNEVSVLTNKLIRELKEMKLQKQPAEKIKQKQRLLSELRKEKKARLRKSAEKLKTFWTYKKRYYSL